jgi:hypothetical protein
MIHDIDEALRTLITRDALGDADVEVVFDAPTKDWAARRNAPTLDVYLYDIREDLKRRSYGTLDLKGPEGRTRARQQPPRYYKFSYLVTAWTQRPEDEHRLLSAVLICFLRADMLPRDVLGGSLAGIGLPVPVTIGLPPPEDRSLSDVWSALGGELKPSLDLVVSCPIDARGEWATGPPVLEDPRFRFRDGATEEEARRRRRGAAAAAAAGVALAEEVIEAGAPGRKGRIFRIRNTTETAVGPVVDSGQADD